MQRAGRQHKIHVTKKTTFFKLAENQIEQRFRKQKQQFSNRKLS